jgi:hypothetical protein
LQISTVKANIVKVKAAWFSNPEVLENSSIGLKFKPPTNDSKTKQSLTLQVYLAEYKNEDSSDDSKAENDGEAENEDQYDVDEFDDEY